MGQIVSSVAYSMLASYVIAFFIYGIKCKHTYR